MRGPRVVPVTGNSTLPDRVDVVIVGGGIVGASTALELADRGLKVALCEKGGIGQEQSSRNWGWVRISNRHVVELPMAYESMRLWGGMDERTGRKTGYVKSGIVFTDYTEQAVETRRAWMENLKPYQLQPQFVGQRGFEDWFPGTNLKVTGAVLSPFDGRAEPQWAAPAIAEAARDRGATIHVNCAVRGIETTAGLVSAAVTEAGTIKCDAVVLAGGAWSSLLARKQGVEFPQLDAIASSMRTAPIEGGPEHSLQTRTFGFRKREDGGYNIGGYLGLVDIVPSSFRYARQFIRMAGTQRPRFQFGARFFRDLAAELPWQAGQRTPFEKQRILAPALPKHQERVLAEVAELFPVFKGARIEETWAGYIDVTPDSLPVISKVDAVPGFHIASGFSGHGFGTAPGAGLLMADLVTGKTPYTDPAPFRFERFGAKAAS